MSDAMITRDMLVEVFASVPTTKQGVLDPAWLSGVLAHLAEGRKVASVTLEDVKQAMASKLRVAVTFEGQPETVFRLCIKGFIDFDLDSSSAMHTISMRESAFYLDIAPRISMHTPPCAVIVKDPAQHRCVFVMADMISAGAHFYDATEPFSIEQVTATLDQLARLHARSELLAGRDWIPNRLDELLSRAYLSWEQTQLLMHDERRGNLPERVLDARSLQCAIEKLALLNRQLPQSILHGDTHPGNIYRTADGQLGFTDWQLIQHGHWSLDIAYHINSVLPIEVAQREERSLLAAYLDALAKHGGTPPGLDHAWEQYQCATPYGYYHWAITQRVRPVSITHQTFRRLGAAVERHESYQRLGLNVDV